mgnify:FL=1
MFTTTVYLLIQMVLSYIEHKRCMVLRVDYFNNMHITVYTLIIFSSVNIDGIFIHEHKLTFKFPFVAYCTVYQGPNPDPSIRRLNLAKIWRLSV